MPWIGRYARPYHTPMTTAMKTARKMRSRAHHGSRGITCPPVHPNAERRTQNAECRSRTPRRQLLNSSFCVLRSAFLHFFRLILAEQSRRTKQQDHDQDDERDRVAIVGKLRAADERFD